MVEYVDTYLCYVVFPENIGIGCVRRELPRDWRFRAGRRCSVKPVI